LKTGIDHLPEDKQAELQTIVQSILRRFPAEMIILFGSFARGDWKEHRYKEDGITYEYQSDYDILIVINFEAAALKKENSKKWQYRIRRDSGIALNTIFHGIDYLNAEIEEGSYFFVDILKEGVMLHDSGNFQLATPKALNPQQRRNKAQMYFDNWFKSGEMFTLDFRTNFERAENDSDFFKQAIFMLHQTTERYYMCMILVYTDYKPKTHDLEKLDKQASKLDNRFKIIFPRSTDEEERLFLLLKNAYIDSRYKLDYSVAREELEYLSGCVTRLRNLTETACKGKIESFG
jgi:uncharacterized protein